MMKKDDFCWMRQGRHLRFPSSQDIALTRSQTISNGKNKRAILMLHGFSSTPAVFRTLIPMIQTIYDGIYAPLLPAHGENLSAFMMMKKEILIDFSETICSELIQKYDEVHVLGLSMGGLITLHLSEKLPIRHLYLLAPALDIVNNLTRTLCLATFLKKVGFLNIRSAAGDLMSLQGEELAYRNLPISSVIELLQWIRDISLVIPKCPIELFLGQNDHVVDSSKVAAKFEAFNHIRIHWLKNSAHVLPLDEDTAEIGRLIRACV